MVSISFYHIKLQKKHCNKELLMSIDSNCKWRYNLQALSVLEIARHTYHSPRSVDAYLKAFDSVLILHLYGLNPKLMATVLGRGESLI
ncbi:MAG TPA: hypothetical protein DEA73_05150 [Peptococcaceae bacterium]|nr:hypothetical protein [Peptococcaceae bacterium]